MVVPYDHLAGVRMSQVVIHYNEIGLKGKNQPLFLRRLEANLLRATTGTGVRRVVERCGRMVLPLSPEADWPTIRKRGIETLTAAGLCAELGGFDRFPQTNDALRVPRDRPLRAHQRSAPPSGSITKAGPPHARRLLVEAAQHYRKQPAITDTLARRQHGQDPRVIAIAWRAQRRLYQRWQQLHHERRKPSGVVARSPVARELAAFLWEAATLDA